MLEDWQHVTAGNGGATAMHAPQPQPRPVVKRRSKRRSWIIAGASIVLVLLVLAGVKGTQIAAMIKASKSFAIPPESVTAAKVEASEWQASRSAVGALIAVRAVTVSSEVPGMVRRIAIDSGGFVHRGDVLVELDKSTEEAQLAASRADAELAKANLERTRTLRQSDYTSPADLDAADAKAKGTAANVAQLQAVIAKKTIRAPFDGRVAIKQVELGQVLGSGTPITSLQSIDPMYADFWFPQQALAELNVGMRARLHTDVFPRQVWEGQVETINPEVDVSTRNVRVRATFRNPDGRLKPGMFANVEVLSPD